jgi:hypothetical protein
MSAPIFTTEISPNVLVDLRPGLPLDATVNKLGPLADLVGTWIGTGFNLISLPAFDKRPPNNNSKDFRLLLNTTVEILEFNPIGATVPNRGSFKDLTSGQKDIDIYGLRYLQRVADGKNHQPLHVEPGFWLNVPETIEVTGATEQTVFPASVVRQGVIPHGNSLLALGPHTSPTDRAPDIEPVDSIPIKHKIPPGFDESYLSPFNPQEGEFNKELIRNPNLALTRAIEGQNIIKTVTLKISAENPKETGEDPCSKNGRIGNIPFIVTNADVTRFDATFWIETIENPGSDGGTFLQLQYTQKVILDFLDIDWPHISVATLIKQ